MTCNIQPVTAGQKYRGVVTSGEDLVMGLDLWLLRPLNNASHLIRE